MAKGKGSDEGHDGRDDMPHEYASPPCYLSELDPDYLGMASDDPTARWRKIQRQRLRELRDHLLSDERKQADQAILVQIDREQVLGAVDTGIFWPLEGEFDSRPLMERVLDAGGRVAIPVVVARDAPLEFWRWDRGTPMQSQGPWSIPAPKTRDPLQPDLLIIPLLGFDRDGHRLGNGGGYFDRTLAFLDPKPVTIGVGYEVGRLDTIYPQAHDVALDAIVTERGFTWHRPPPDR
jgi:5,10-methenyltetrahydrofolate synthetase